MRKAIGQGVVALVLLALGFAAWTFGTWQSRVADAREELALLKYDAIAGEYDDLAQSMGLVGRVPWLADGVLTDIERDRAAAAYWQAQYDALEAPRDASGATVEQEPALLSVSANAAYRSGQRASGGDRQAMLRQLDAALKSYTNLLKKNGGDVDAAYNYEFVARLRDALSKSRPQPGRREDSDAHKSSAPTMAGDLPEGRTLHGDPGAPPPATDMTQFKMHIPVRPDERQGGSDAGQGKQKVRKG